MPEGVFETIARPPITEKCTPAPLTGFRPNPAASSLTDRMLYLQRTLGNRAVQRLLQAQPKLTIGGANDPYEQEADRIADHLMQTTEASMDTVGAQSAFPIGHAQRACKNCKDELHRKPEEQPEDGAEDPRHTLEQHTASADAESAIDSQKHGGEPLPRASRQFFESRLGHDLGHVRLHTDPAAAQTAEAISARAFTVGNHISFATGEYAPQSGAGKRLLAHELVHVVQQTGQPAAAQTTAQRTPVERYVADTWLQGKWTMEAPKVMTHINEDATSDHGSTLPLTAAGIASANASAEQKQGIMHQKVGGNARTSTSSMTRYVFKNDGKDSDFLQVVTHGSVDGTAKAERLHDGRAAGVVWGQVVERTAENPTPEPRSLFDPIKAGGASSAKIDEIGAIDADISLGEKGAIRVHIPLKKVNEGTAAPFSVPLDLPRDFSAKSSEVEVTVGSHAQAAADIEDEFLGLSPLIFGSDQNKGVAAGTYTVTGESRPAPVALPVPSDGGSASGPGAIPQPGQDVGPAARKWGCRDVRCNVYKVDPEASCPDRVTGETPYIHNSYDDACDAATSDANSKVPRGCNKRHCNCTTKCTQK